MDIFDSLISVLYYAFTGFIAILLIYNVIKSKDWKEEILYVIVLLPFLLRLFMLK
ncbi:hypothetical protein ACFLTI_06430 [Bacteroidota bacterium]